MKYVDSPSLCSTRFTDISAYWDHGPAALPRLLSNVSSTLARATGLRNEEPLKITSCMESPRRAEARDSPKTQRTASMMFDLPQPFGPTTPTSLPGTLIDVGSTNDLNPESFRCVRRTSVCVFIKRKPAGAGTGTGAANVGAYNSIFAAASGTPCQASRTRLWSASPIPIRDGTTSFTCRFR